MTSVHWHEEHAAFSTSRDGSATLWDTRQRDAAVAELQTTAALLAGRAGGGGGLLVAADDEGEVTVWDVSRSSAPLLQVAPHETGWVARGIALSGSTALVCGSRAEGRAGFLSVLDLSSGRVTASAMPDVPPLGAVCALGSRALVGCRDGRVFVYDALRASALSEAECAAGLEEGTIVRATPREATTEGDGLKRRKKKKQGRRGALGDGDGASIGGLGGHAGGGDDEDDEGEGEDEAGGRMGVCKICVAVATVSLALPLLLAVAYTEYPRLVAAYADLTQ